jgi:hypothetical protein
VRGRCRGNPDSAQASDYFRDREAGGAHLAFKGWDCRPEYRPTPPSPAEGTRLVRTGQTLAAVVLILIPACGKSAAPTEVDVVGPGDARYSVTYAGGAAPTTTWTGTARLGCLQSVGVEVSATSTAPGSDAWWSVIGDIPARSVGAHPILGGRWAGDTVQVWWGHVVSGDARTHGTLTIRLTTPGRLDAHFIYTGPAGVGIDTVMATVEGDFSALLPPYLTNPGC